MLGTVGDRTESFKLSLEATARGMGSLDRRGMLPRTGRCDPGSGWWAMFSMPTHHICADVCRLHALGGDMVGSCCGLVEYAKGDPKFEELSCGCATLKKNSDVDIQ